MHCYIALTDSWADHSAEHLSAIAAEIGAAGAATAVIEIEAVRLQPEAASNPEEDASDRPDWTPEGLNCAVKVRWEALGDGADERGLISAIGRHTDPSLVWPVTEHINVGLEGATEAPAIARFAVFTRIPSISAEQFGSHWLREHAPLVLRHGPLFRRYEAHVARPDQPAPPWDGVAVQWFATQADADEHYRQIREEKPEVREDILRFAGRGFQLLATERLVVRTHVRVLRS